MGLRYISGEIVAFSDDDRLYQLDDLLKKVLDIFESHPEWHGVSGRATIPEGKPALIKWATRLG